MQANRAHRQNHNLKVTQKTSRGNVGMSLPNPTATFGKPNRPQTPVNGIITNTYGCESEAVLQARYQNWKQSRGASKGGIGIRMTNAQIHADNAVRQKNAMAERKPEFKLKRFQNVEPRTSTKRGENAFMSQKLQQQAAAAEANNI